MPIALGSVIVVAGPDDAGSVRLHVAGHLGCSPDLADAYVMALWSEGNAFAEALAKAYGRRLALEPAPTITNPHPISADWSFHELLEKHGIRIDGVD